MHRLLLCAVGMAALVLTACGGGAATPTAPPAAATEATVLPIGGRADLPGGGSLTIHAVEFPVASPKYPQPGVDILAADVEHCAGPEVPGGTMESTGFHFSLRMPDSTKAGVSLGEKDPSYINSTLGPGDCNRGWVTFAVPTGRVPALILYEDVIGDESVVHKWALE